MKKENMTHNKEENQLIKTDTELTQILKSADKNIKTVMIIIFHMFKKLSKGMEDIYTYISPNQVSRSEKYNEI